MKLFFVFFTLCFAFQLSAQVLDELKLRQQEMQQAAADREAVSVWQRSNPSVRVFSQAIFNQMSIMQQFEHEGYGFLFVYAGTDLTLSDINAYQQRVRSVVQRTGPQYKDYLFQTDRAQYDRRTGAAGLPAVQSDAIPATPQVATPVYTPNQITRAQYNAMPAAKQTYVDAHPNDYIIID